MNLSISIFKIFLIFHIAYVLFFNLIFYEFNSFKNFENILKNNLDIDNIIFGDSTGVSAFENGQLYKSQTVNISFFGENIICTYIRLKKIKEKYDLDTNLFLPGSRYIFTRGEFCNQTGQYLRANYLSLDDYKEYYSQSNDLSKKKIIFRFISDNLYFRFFFDLYDISYLKVLSRRVDEILYNLFNEDKINLTKKIDQNLNFFDIDQNFESKNNFIKFIFDHREKDELSKQKDINQISLTYLKKIENLNSDNDIIFYIPPHYNWESQLYLDKKITLNFIDLFNEDIDFFYNSSHLNRIGSFNFTKLFVKYLDTLK